MENNYCVYIHTSPDGKVYIGRTSRKPEIRWRKNGTGYYSSPYFYSAIKEYGWDNFGHEVIKEGLTKDEAGQLEKELIEQYNSTDRRFGYNSKTGGDYDVVYNDECKQAMSKKMKVVFSSPELREKMRYARLGKHHTPEAKAKISAIQRGRQHHMSEEGRKRKIAATKAYTRLPEVRERLIKQGKVIAKYGMMKSRKVYQCDDFGNILCEYSSMKEAGRATGIRDGNISKCCNGLVKHAGGYTWRFAN